MAITKPIIAEIAYKTWCINEFGMNSLYLLEGDEKALLIDAGTGTFDIPALIRQLTEKPLIVALTHGHIDHVGGMGFFNEVYIHPDDILLAQSVTVADRREYVNTMMSISTGLYGVTPEDIIVFDSCPQFLPLYEGDIIHLGNRDVEVYETPGHTPGGLSFLERKERILFSGDACYSTILLAFSGANINEGQSKIYISDVLCSAKKLYALSAYFDRNYYGHVGEANIIDILPSQPDLIESLIDLCQGLLFGAIQGSWMPQDLFCGEHLEACNNHVRIQYHPWQLR